MKDLTIKLFLNNVKFFSTSAALKNFKYDEQVLIRVIKIYYYESINSKSEFNKKTDKKNLGCLKALSASLHHSPLQQS